MRQRANFYPLFYAVGTLVGGVGAPALLGKLIETGSRTALMWGYVLGGSPMVGTAIVEVWIGVKAEGKSLESIPQPLPVRK